MRSNLADTLTVPTSSRDVLLLMIDALDDGFSDLWLAHCAAGTPPLTTNGQADSDDATATKAAGMLRSLARGD